MTIGKENSSFELDAERVKKQNSSPGTLDLIMHVTSELPIGLSYDLLDDFNQTANTSHKINIKWFFAHFYLVFFLVATKWRILGAKNQNLKRDEEILSAWPGGASLPKFKTVCTIKCIDRFGSAFGVTPASNN